MTITHIRQALRILFRYDEKARLNLFEVFPWFKSFLTNRRNFAYMRSVGDAIFALIILFGIFGPQEPSRNISLFVAWGLWWTSIVLSWFFVGKFWCGICPFPGLGRILQRLGLSLNLEVPDFLKKNVIHISMVLLALIIWAESVTDMKNWPMGTAFLLLSIVLGATLFEVIFRGQAWCRYACPMGKIIGSASTLSIIEFRPDHSLCRGCRSLACKKGRDGVPGCPVYLGAVSVRNSIDCLACGRCVALCDRDSPRFNLRNPYVELVMNKGRNLTCSYIIPFLIGSQLARFLQHKPWYSAVEGIFFGSNLVAFSALLAAGFGFVLLVIRTGARLFTITEDEVFGRFSPMVPVLIPLAFTGELVYRLDYFLANVGDFLPTLGRQFGFRLEHLGFSVHETFVAVTGYLIFLVGAVAGIYVLRLLHRGDFEGIIPGVNYVALHGLVLALFLVYMCLY